MKGLCGFPRVGVDQGMATKRTRIPADAAEQIIHTALTAFGRGAGRLSLDPPAMQSFREQFTPKVKFALERPDWQDNWRREKAYLLAYAKAMGQRARMLAADDRRSYISAHDIDVAIQKLRGYMPVAGRWCPS
jgi:hypothetical protein